ncbi:MAG: DUF6036 family nucleotidyltransferase [Sideroxyarcus sp.]|nr:DUF6036 family nucleotidyltransferase [Sideroxyarcus sp.]
MSDIHFHLDKPMAKGLGRLLARLSAELELKSEMDVYIAGGIAVHLYTGVRVTSDVDAEFSKRFLLPKDMIELVDVGNGELVGLHIDPNYNSSFALLHEDYLDDAIPVGIQADMLRVHILSPVDLAVSKISRLSDIDRGDIEALAAAGLVTAEQIEARAHDALGGYVGNQRMILVNIKDAVLAARLAEPISPPPLK